MSKPNVFFIMTDQHRWDCIGRWNEQIKTPAIDSLADEGIIFKQTVCQAPMCVPSRNSLMFGLYPSQLGVRNNYCGINDEAKLPSKPLPQILRDEGYLCAGFGKTHWGHSRGHAEPSTRGFEVRADGQDRESGMYEAGAAIMGDEDPEGLAAYYAETSGFGVGEEASGGYAGCVSRLPPEHHRDGFIHKKCMEFLEAPPADRPLFLYLSFIKPHPGFNIPPEFEALYDIGSIPDMEAPPWEGDSCTHLGALTEAGDEMRRMNEERRDWWGRLSALERRRTRLRYWANCSFMDHFIGSVLDKARSKGLLDNALILFCSDHGDMLGERDGRFAKYCLFESSVRVPLILSGSVVPQEKKGTVDDRPAELIDIIPTVCAAAGIRHDPRLPGLDLLSGRRRAGAFSELHGYGSEERRTAPAWMWRTEDYKLILFRRGSVAGDTPPMCELYDLRRDPHERVNLYADLQYQAVKAEMMEGLLSHIATAYAKGPALWDYGGLAILGMPGI